ncbi:hypothetical protein L0F63_004189 [Massospora cicadina]|nr:hypothetical protein L0F63_004189 [Massospora cicadina]
MPKRNVSLPPIQPLLKELTFSERQRRNRITRHQLKSSSLRSILSIELNLPSRVIQIWFQNKRQALRRQPFHHNY